MTEEAKKLRQALLERVHARNKRASELPIVEAVLHVDESTAPAQLALLQEVLTTDPATRALARVVALSEELVVALERLQRHDPSGKQLGAALAIERTLLRAYADELERRRVAQRGG